MKATESETRDPESRARPFLSLALGGCCLVVAGMIAMTVVSDQQNHAAVDAETSAVRAAVASEVDAIGQRLRAFVAAQPGFDTPAVTELAGPFHALFAASSPQPERAIGLSQPTDRIAAHDDLRAALEPLFGRPIDASGHAELLNVSDKTFITIAVGATSSTKPTASSGVVVAVEPVDDAMLARIARNAAVRPVFAVQASQADEASITFRPQADGPGLTLTWAPGHPGNRLYRTAGSILASLGALLTLSTLLLSRRMTRALAESEARAKADAAHDLLTGLANRTAFSRHLHREVERAAQNKERQFALIYLDIDRFKDINDTYGHGAGDRVIVTAAQRIAATLRAGSLVARIGGDEFAVLVTDLRSPSECAEIARRILALFTEPVDIGAHRALVGISIGIALCPHDAHTADGIINSADLALYRAKNEGRNRFCFFEQRMGDELRMRKTVEDDLRIAIETDQLIMEFQPVVSLDGRKTVGVEALVRWRHPTKGTIAPGSFITLAEECGLILPLGEWVMRSALREARRWPGLRVAVNVSAIQFRQKNFVATVQKLLAEAGVEPGQLELELTESVLLADADQAEDAMIELRAMGVRLALDDFGTGYSSLIYLRRFAFDKIKIDKSFLESTESTGESAIIVHSIVHLGRALGLTVTAEGVETQEQHRFMQALGCHELQGFLFSPPVSAAEIDRRLEEAPVTLRSVA